MAESSAWATLRQSILACKLLVLPNVQRIENAVATGTPDTFMSAMFTDENKLCPCGIWFEGKHVVKWPARESTKVDIGLTPQQANKLFANHVAGFPTGVWVRVSDGLQRYPIASKQAWLWFTANDARGGPMLYKKLAHREITCDEAIENAAILPTSEALARAIAITAASWTLAIKPKEKTA